MSWSEEDLARVAELAAEGRGEWEFLPPLPAGQTLPTFWPGACIARMRPDGRAELLELRGTDSQNALVLERAGMAAELT